MSDDATLAVVAGLVVGVAFVIIIAISFSQSKEQNEPTQRTVSVVDKNIKQARLNGSISFDSDYTINDTSSIGNWRAIEQNEPNETEQLNRIQSTLRSCERHYVHIRYGLEVNGNCH